MHNGDRLSDLERHVREAAAPPADAIDRVVERALGSSEPQRWPKRLGAAVLMACALLLVVLAARLLRRPPPARPASSSLAITGDGSLLVVTGDGGRRWIIGPAAERRTGSYVIVVTD